MSYVYILCALLQQAMRLRAETVFKVCGGIEEGGECRVVAEEVEEEVLGGDAVVRACARAQELVGLQSLLC